jgi:hypothetical protein
VELVTVAAGAEPQPLELHATDAAGNTTTARAWLRGPRVDERGAGHRESPPAKVVRRGKRRAAVTPATAPLPHWEFATLPERRLRVRVTGAPAGLRDVVFERGVARGLPGDTALATWDGRAWVAVLDLSNTPDPEGLWIKGKRADRTAWWVRGSFAFWPTGTPLPVRIEDWAGTRIERDRVFEPGVVVARTTSFAGAKGFVAARGAVELLPVSPPLARTIPITLAPPVDLPRDRMGVYRRDHESDAWDWIDADWDSVARAFKVNAGRLGQFAMLRDTTPPLAAVLTPASRAAEGPYPRWRLSARVRDAASGILARSSAFTVDDARVPTEWDAEEGVLRWRPLVPPAPGTHRYRLEVTDRVGNRTVRSGTFVIASANPKR